MKKYTSPNNDIRKKITLREAIKKYKHDKKVIKKNLEVAELEENVEKYSFYEKKLKKLQQTRGKAIRKSCEKALVLIIIPSVMLTSAVAAPTYAHHKNVTEIVNTIEEKQGIDLENEDGKIDYNKTAIAMVKEMVAKYYNISPSEIEILADYYNDIRPAGSTALRGGETYSISINKIIKGNGKNGKTLSPICTYDSYSEVDSFGNNKKTDTFPKGAVSRKVLNILKKVARGRAGSPDITSLNGLSFDNLPPSLPTEKPNDMER